MILPVGLGVIPLKKPQSFGKRGVTTSFQWREEDRPLCVKRFPNSLAHGMEYLSMPAPSYRTRRNNRPTYTRSASTAISASTFPKQAEVGTFDPQELTERSYWNMREWQPGASRCVPVSRQTRPILHPFSMMLGWGETPSFRMVAPHSGG